jgi:hypothetical protein
MRMRAAQRFAMEQISRRQPVRGKLGCAGNFGARVNARHGMADDPKRWDDSRLPGHDGTPAVLNRISELSERNVNDKQRAM